MTRYRFGGRGIASAVAAAVAVTVLVARVHAQCAPDWIAGAGVPGVDSSINTMVVWDNGGGPSLYAGGFFSVAGNNRADRIARWDGTNWLPLDSGFDGAVLALAVYKGELIAGGTFRTAGGFSASRIARWNGTTWSTLGSGIDGWVYALTVYNDQLIAAGSFLSAGGVGANYIARWDGRGASLPQATPSAGQQPINIGYATKKAEYCRVLQ